MSTDRDEFRKFKDVGVPYPFVATGPRVTGWTELPVGFFAETKIEVSEVATLTETGNELCYRIGQNCVFYCEKHLAPALHKLLGQYLEQESRKPMIPGEQG